MPALGVTSALGVMSKGEAFYGWIAKTVAEYWRYALLEQGYDPKALDILVRESKKARFAVTKDAADIGTEAHGWIEGFLNDIAAGTVPLEAGMQFWPEHPQVRSCCEAAVNWLVEHHVRPIHIEKRLYSREYGYAGTADLIAYVDDELCLLDWKTSNSLHPEYLLQTAAYVSAYEEETGQHIATRWLVRLGKNDGAFEAIERHDSDYPKDREAFLSALKLYEWQCANHNFTK